MTSPAITATNPQGQSSFLKSMAVWLDGPDTQSALTKSPALTGWARIATLVLFACLVLARLPEATLNGRFQGEEGQIFFGYAWHRDAWDALWRSFAGYMNLGANGATLLAARMVQWGLVSLENAPRITMAVSLLFQVLPPLLLLTGRASWLASRWSVLAAVLVIALCPRSEEVWLNSMHIQYHLALCCGLMLALDTPNTKLGRAGYGLILFLAPLCGPGAVVMLPFFVLKALIERTPDRIGQMAVLLLGCAIQMLFFYTQNPMRGHLIDPPSLALMMFVRLGIVPLLGNDMADVFGSMTYLSRGFMPMFWWPMVLTALAFLALIAWAAWRSRNNAAGWLIAAAMGLAVVSFGDGLLSAPPEAWFSPQAGERYNFIPLAMLSIGMVAFASLHRANGGSNRAKWLCAFVLAIWITNFTSTNLELSHGPNWQQEVAKWNQNHNYRPKNWQFIWRVDLSDADRPCPTGRTIETASFDDPSYCESGWLVAMRYISNDTRFNKFADKNRHKR